MEPPGGKRCSYCHLHHIIAAPSLHASDACVDIVCIGAKYWIFELSSAWRMRFQHQVIGHAVGILPAFQQQILLEGPPLCLSKEEAEAAVALGIARIVVPNPRSPVLPLVQDEESPTVAACIQFTKLQKRLAMLHAQKKLLAAGKTVPVQRIAAVMGTSFRRHEQAALALAPDSNLPVITPRWMPVEDEDGETEIEISSSSIAEEKAKTDWTVSLVQSCQKAGVCLTDGLKFGGDYLMYHSHPNVTHADSIVRVVPGSIPAADVVCQGRLASSTNKSLILCDQSGGVVQISFLPQLK
jgi:tRNA splicing endonuclease